MNVLQIGGYFPKDENGFIKNPAKWSNVPKSLQQLIYKLIEEIPQEEKSQLHSIYLRGSLPRKIEEKYVADIDLFALTNKKGLKWEQEKWVNELTDKISKSNNKLPNIEFTSTTFDEHLIKSYPQLAAIIKTQSICIFGTDFSKKLPNFKPGKTLSLNYRWLEKDIEKALSQNAKISDKKNALKTLIRTGFELVAERENEYTPDLYWCCKSYCKWYPKMADQMTKALQFYLNPETNEKAINSLLEHFGIQIVKETLKYRE